MIRVDSNQLIAGKILVSAYAGHGIIAQDIPSTGANGPGYLFNDITAPTDRMRGQILTWPAAGTLAVNEDSSFSFTNAPNGSYAFTYRGFRNGVTYGDFTVSLTLGAGEAAELVASAVGISAATAALATQIVLAASAAGLSTATGSLVVDVALAASAFSESSAGAQLDDMGNPIAANAFSVSGASADLQVAIMLSASALGLSVATANLKSVAEAYTPHESRTVFVDATEWCKMNYRRYAHSPDAELDYAFNWQENKWLQPGESVVSSVWASAGDLVFSRHQIVDGGTTSVFIGGGKDGYTYRVTNTITTSAGRIDSRTITLVCKPR